MLSNNFVFRLKKYATDLGFSPVAIIPARPSEHTRYYADWLANGFHAEMSYLARPDAVARRADLSRTVPNAKTVVVVAANYHTTHLPPEILSDPPPRIIAPYS